MKNNKMKKILTVMLASLMLLGLSVTVSAQSAGASGKDNHVHDYYPSKSYYKSYTVGSHPYLVARIHHDDGSVEEKYGSCDRVIYYYNYIFKCECGDSYKDGGGQEIRHMQCGAPNE